MKQTNKTSISNVELYSTVYLTALFILGWLMDTNSIFLSQYFHLFGMITIPTVGALIGYAFIKITKKKQQSELYIVKS